MPTDRNARAVLRNALARYMTGEIGTFAFDDANSNCCQSSDANVKAISRVLYSIHDDTVDHPICVTSDGWVALRRVLAFLDTDLDIATKHDESAWPFCDHEQWQANEHRANAIVLPQYDPAIHFRHIHPWWNRIPSGVGFAIIAVVGILLAVVLALTMGHRRTRTFRRHELARPTTQVVKFEQLGSAQ